MKKIVHILTTLFFIGVFIYIIKSECYDDNSISIITTEYFTCENIIIEKDLISCNCSPKEDILNFFLANKTYNIEVYKDSIVINNDWYNMPYEVRKPSIIMIDLLIMDKKISMFNYDIKYGEQTPTRNSLDRRAIEIERMKRERILNYLNIN